VQDKETLQMRTRTRSLSSAIVIASLGWTSGPDLLAQSGQVLTLAEAINEALDHNDRMLGQNDAVEQAALGVRLAENTFKPKLVPNILGSFGQTDVSNQNYRLDLTQRFTTGTEMRMGIGTSTAQIPPQPDSPPQEDIRFYNADTTFTLSQPLLRGFGSMATRRSLSSAELRRADAQRQRTIAGQQMAVEVASAYYRVVGQQALLEVAKQSLERTRKLLEASQAKLEAGLVSQLDVYRAQQLTSQGELQLSDTETAVEDALEQLRLLMGRDPDSPLQVAGDIPNIPGEVMSVEEAVALALASRMDLVSVTAATADADRAIAFSRNQLRPQFDVNLAMTRRETAESLPDSFGLNRFRFATFFTISMPVDRTPQLVEYQNALIDRDRRRRETETLRKQIAADVRRGLRQTNRMSQRLSLSEAALEISRKEVEVAQFRYERGLSNNLDVVTAEGNLLNAESRRIAALAELAVARLSLRATLGILDPRKDIGTAAGPVQAGLTHE
jgi:outer membrane protein TolC